MDFKILSDEALNRYVRVQEDGSAGVTLSFDKMLEEYQRNNNAPIIAGYTNEEFRALMDADSASSTPEYSIDMFVDTVGMYIRNDISSGKQLTVEEQLAIDRFNKARWRTSSLARAAEFPKVSNRENAEKSSLKGIPWEKCRKENRSGTTFLTLTDVTVVICAER